MLRRGTATQAIWRKGQPFRAIRRCLRLDLHRAGDEGGELAVTKLSHCNGAERAKGAEEA